LLGALGILLGSVLLVLAAQAQTADGVSPAEEGICADESGPALGLCQAYCEAMDCDSDTPQASEQACDRVGENFERMTGEQPPCALPPCPCFDAADLEAQETFQGCFFSDGEGEVRFDNALFSVTKFGGVDRCLFYPEVDSTDISGEEALSCLAVMEAFCQSR
jgi:hypothetical protein